MAGGTDQSVNLSGMLNQIAGTLAEGYQIGGVSAGEYIATSFGNALRPDVDYKDPKSIREYANWLQRNGRPEEAERALLKASELEQKNVNNHALISSTDAVSAGNQAIVQGDERFLNAQIAKIDQNIKAAVQNGADPSVILQLQQQKEQLGSQQNRGLAKTNSVNATAQGIMEYEKRIAQLDPVKDAATIANLERAIAELEKKDGVSQAVTELKVKDAQNQTILEERAWLQDKPAIASELMSSSADDFDSTVQELLNKYPQYATQINGLVQMAGESMRSLDYLRESFRLDTYDPETVKSTMVSSIEDDATLTEGQKTELIRRINEDVKSNRDDGTWDNLGDRRQAEKMLTQIAQDRFNMVNEAHTAQRNADMAATADDRAYLTRLERAAVQGPSDEQVMDQIRVNLSKQGKDEETFTEGTKEERQVMMDEAKIQLAKQTEQVIFRERVRQGLEEPISELDDEDYDTFVSVMDSGMLNGAELVDYMVRLGYEEDAVVALMTYRNAFKEGEVRATYTAVKDNVDREDEAARQEITLPKTAYDERTRTRGVESAVEPGQSARDKLEANPFVMPTLTPTKNKLREAKEAQSRGEGFTYGTGFTDLMEELRNTADNPVNRRGR